MEEKYKIGNFLTELRNEKKLTQSQLANKLNLTEKAISRWENGRCMPETKHLLLLSKIYNISIDELLHGQRIKDENEKSKISIKDYEILKLNNKYNHVLIFIIAVSSFLSLFNFYIFALNKTIGVIYSLCIFIFTIFAIYTFHQSKHMRIFNIENSDKNDKLKKCIFKKIKKNYKTALIINLLIITCIITLYAIDFIFFEKIQNIFSIEIIIPFIFIISISPSISFFVICLINKQNIETTGFNVGWLLGNLLSYSWAGLFLAILISPVFALIFYCNAVLVLIQKEN